MQHSEAYRAFQVAAFHGGEEPLPIRTSSISRSRQGLERPRQIDVSNNEKPLERGHLATANHSQSRRASKAGFKGLFNRTRSSTPGVPRVLMETSQDQTVTAQKVVPMDTVILKTTEANVVPMETSTTKAFPTIPKAPSRQTWISHNEEILAESGAVWAPPPLSQAYPQVVKSAMLMAPPISHDALRRNPNKAYRQKRTNSKSEFADSHNSSGPTRKNYIIRTPEYTSMHGWTTKIYMLTTSGYLLQYASEGGSNRLPEKTMQLWKESVAFASDAIPGKHWVLQISQTPDVESNVFTDVPRSIFGKLAPREQIDETPNSFLLVLNSPQEMESWLAAVRNEIQALGTTTLRPELQCSDPITEDSQQIPRRPNGGHQIEIRPEEVDGALERGPTPKSSVAEVAKLDRRTMQLGDPMVTEYGRGRSFISRQATSLYTTASPLDSTDSAVCGRIRNSSTASNTSAGSTTLIPSAGSSTANLLVASASTFPDAFTSSGNHTGSSVLDTRRTHQSPAQTVLSSLRKPEAWQARTHQHFRHSQEPYGSRNRFSSACWISDVRKPYATAMVPPPMLPPTPPASATDFGRSFPIATAVRKEDLSSRPSPMAGELPVSSGQPCLSATTTYSHRSPKLQSAKGCLHNPPLSPYALTTFDLYGLSHTRPHSNPVKPDLPIPRRTSSLRHSRRFLAQTTTKPSFSPPASAHHISPALARGMQLPRPETRPVSGPLVHASMTARPHLASVKSDTAAPRRYSSIGHPRILSPEQPLYQAGPSAPAPTTACPSPPPRKNSVQHPHDRQWFTSAHSGQDQDQDQDHDHNQPPTHAPAASDSIPPFHRESTHHPLCPRASLQPQPAMSYPPSALAQRGISNRRSTSQIPALPFLGPPVCPPPSCPLPRIPCVGLARSEGSLDGCAGRGGGGAAEVLVWGCLSLG